MVNEVVKPSDLEKSVDSYISFFKKTSRQAVSSSKALIQTLRPKVSDKLIDEVKNSFIQSTNRLVSVAGVSDLVVVETKDSILIANKNQSSMTSSMVNKLKKQQRDEADIHTKVYRPWGFFDAIESGDGFQVKKLKVNPGAKLSHCVLPHKTIIPHNLLSQGGIPPQDVPSRPQDGFSTASRRLQDAPRWPQDGPKSAPRRPVSAPRRLQDAPRRLQHATRRM